MSTWHGILKRGNAHAMTSKRVGYFYDAEIVVVEALGSWIGGEDEIGAVLWGRIEGQTLLAYKAGSLSSQR